MISFRARSALREVGKALGFPLDLLNQASKSLDTHDAKAIGQSQGLREFIGQRRDSRPWLQLVELCGQIAGLPRHLGLHNGGMIVTGPLMAERVATEPAAMPGRWVIQWDKYSLEDAGLIKIDLLGLRMLAAINEAVALIKQTTGEQIELDKLPFTDKAVYDMISDADTVGVFQVESRAQAQNLPRIRPSKFEDLIVSISLIRPGPIQGNMVHPYVRRRLGKEPVSYLHPALKPSLEETLGVLLYQEQVLTVSRDLAGFTPGQGELLRRALGAKDGDEKIGKFHDLFLQGAQVRGVSKTVAESVFGKLRAFGSYSFAKSHAASFAVIVYQSAWLKRYHPVEFLCALLNQQPMGFWHPSVLVSDARRRGIRTLPADINLSRAKSTVEAGCVRLGFTYVHGLSEERAARLEAARADRPFASLADFCRRTGFAKRVVENLILAGTMDSWGLSRRELIWKLAMLPNRPGELPLVFEDETFTLPPETAAERMAAERELLGVSTGSHVMERYRPWLKAKGILSYKEFEAAEAGKQVQVAGLIVVHQAPPTAKNFHFVTLEMEDGLSNVIVNPDVYPAMRRVLRDSPLVVFSGRVQRQDGVINLLAQQVMPIPQQAGSGLSTMSNP